MIPQPAPAPARPNPPAARPGSEVLDLLGRVPIPLRRSFAAGLERALAAQRARGGPELACRLLGGGQWQGSFAQLAGMPTERLPHMLVSHLGPEVATPRLLAHYAPASPRLAGPACHPLCRQAGLPDPLGAFRLFAVVPFVFLVDRERLAGRPLPQAWPDLLEAHWAGDIVMGGQAPAPGQPLTEINDYLLMCLLAEHGPAGLRAYAANLGALEHNVRIARHFGSPGQGLGAVAVLPWLQAEMNPRRGRTQVVWPRDGALALPLGCLMAPGARERLAPLEAFLLGPDLAAQLARDCYPPAQAAPGAFPSGARLKWPGWDLVRGQDLSRLTRQALEIFQAAWGQKGAACA